MLIVVFALLALVAILVALWPLLMGHSHNMSFSQEDTPLGRLMLRKEILLGNIADLDFEYEMGKLAADDYEVMRDSLKRQAAHVMEQIDTLGEGHAPAPASASATGSAPATGSQQFCAECGSRLPQQARFCPSCGKQVPA